MSQVIPALYKIKLRKSSLQNNHMQVIKQWTISFNQTKIWLYKKCKIGPIWSFEFKSYHYSHFKYLLKKKSDFHNSPLPKTECAFQ